MIARLKGLIDGVADDSVVIDVNGVGYQVFASSRTLGQLVVGEAASLEIETQVREDHIHLYGFRDLAERDWFRLLTTVQGVGARVALAILTVLPPDQLANAIAAQDKASVARANGVGPKLAARIVSELKDKAGSIALGPNGGGVALPAGGAAGDTAVGSANEDAVSALVNLGYTRSDAFGAVARVQSKLGAEADAAVLIRAGLQELGR